MSRLFGERRVLGRVQTVNEEESKTVQSDAERADIKNILRKYEQTGVLVNMRNVDLAFRDVSEFEDFGDLMRQTKVAEEEFMRLPSKVREIFDHDVMKWLDAAHDPAKLDELAPQLRKLGILDQVDDTPPAEASPASTEPEAATA